MKALIQRVKRAEVRFKGQPVNNIESGLLILVGVEKEDDEKSLEYICDKIVNLRIFESEKGKMERSVLDVNGEILAVSQFTLCADLSKGRRPDFSNAAAPAYALEMYEKIIDNLRLKKLTVKEGKFGHHMEVELINDGPVTIILESPKTS